MYFVWFFAMNAHVNVPFSEQLQTALLRFQPDAAMQHAFRIVHSGVGISDDTPEDVRKLVEGVLKLSLVGVGSDSRITDVRNMFLALATDVRVAVMKLAERSLQMTDSLIAPDLAFETLHLYVPIAKSLGFYDVKRELEDLCFSYLYPKEFAELASQMRSYAHRADDLLFDLQKNVEEVLSAKGIAAYSSGRVKNLYRIFTKLKKKNHTLLEDIFDVIGFRVIVPDDGNVYAALDAIHAAFPPIPDRFKDYVAYPKPNGYCSLHTTVAGLSERPIEIQIRTESMHREAEEGGASHMLYEFTDRRRQARWVTALFSLQNEIGNLNVLNDRIFVLTPNGDVRDLPDGATPVDFAYSIHSDIGDHLHACKVSGSIVPLDKPLATGDIIEIVTRKDAHPRAFWLSFAMTKTARSRINSWLKSHDADEFLKKGRDVFNKHLERLGKPPLDSAYRLLKDCGKGKLSVREREDVLLSIGKGAVSPGSVIRNLFFGRAHRGGEGPPLGERFRPASARAGASRVGEDIMIDGERGFEYRLAHCCSPKKGQHIEGYITRGRGVTVHRPDCPTFRSLERDRRISAHWV